MKVWFQPTFSLLQIRAHPEDARTLLELANSTTIESSDLAADGTEKTWEFAFRSASAPVPPSLFAARISERDRTTLANDQLRVRNALGKLGVDDNDIQLLGSYGGRNMDLSIVVRGELKLRLFRPRMSNFLILSNSIL